MGGENKGLSKRHIFKSVEDSLKRLQTDYIDLYQSHKDDPDTPQQETLEAYAELVKQGKIKAIGASNFSASRLTGALDISKQNSFPVYQTLQPEYNLYAREGYEAELEAVCLEHNIGVITYFSLASGFLTGKYRSESDFGKSARGGGMKRFLNDRGFKILDALDEVSKQLKATHAQIALAWLIARKGISAPIVSATSIEQLNDIMKAVELKLDTNVIASLDIASAWRAKTA